MDNLSHGLLGAVVLKAFSRKPINRYAAMAAFCGALAPDLDVLIRSSLNPLVVIQFHRHFTHSLFFIPFGGILFGFLFWLLFSRQQTTLKSTLWQTTVGYATHALLDTCTSYGTLLLWPLTNKRFAWDIIAIIDPFYTLILLIGFIYLLVKTRSRLLPQLCLLMSCFYLAFGVWQHQQGLNFQERLAKSRGHQMTQFRLLPTFANNWVWRSIYVANGKIYTDAFWMVPTKPVQYWEGDQISQISQTDLLEFSKQSSSIKEQLELYQWFADGYLGKVKEDGRWVIGDFRFAAIPHRLNPIWGIEIRAHESSQPIRKVDFGISFKESWDEFYSMLRAKNSKLFLF